MKKIVVCVDLNQACFETLKKLPEKIDLNNTMVYFVHVIESPLYDDDLSPFSFRLPENDVLLKKTILETLNNFGLELGLSPESVIAKCIFSTSRSEKIKNYLDEVGADLVVIATRGRHGIAGLFSSSLADFLIKFSPCNVLVLRP